MDKLKSPNKGSIKHVMIDKDNARLVLVTSIAVFLVTFSLIAARSLWSQSVYQNKVISAKNKASAQLQANVKSMTTLSKSYTAFTSSSTNVIGGNAIGTGSKDGNNAKIVLDALPSKYDFPALTTSLESIMDEQQVAVVGITGVDDEVAQGSNTSSPSPSPVEIPFQITAAADYSKTQALVGALERSIRPIKITNIDISGSQDKLTTTISAVTYYQPAKSLNIREVIVK